MCSQPNTQPALVIPRLSDLLDEQAYPPDAPIAFAHTPLVSSLCVGRDFLTPGYRHWCARIGEKPRWHRKQWEWCFIAQALYERRFLAPGKRGLGFGVGGEPLSELFASYGAEIVATDAPASLGSGSGWAGTGQWLGHVAQRGICAPELMEQRVRFESVDMRAVPDQYHGRFDFTWSSCALEHLGGIEAGLDFVVAQARCLVQGGVGVHTTEACLFADAPSIDHPGTAVYGRRDIDRLSERLAREGMRLAQVSWSWASALAADRYIDARPTNDEMHLRLLLHGIPATSLALIVIRQTPHAT